MTKQSKDDLFDELLHEAPEPFAQLRVEGPGPKAILAFLEGLLQLDTTREGQTELAGERVDVFEGGRASAYLASSGDLYDSEDRHAEAAHNITAFAERLTELALAVSGTWGPADLTDDALRIDDDFDAEPRDLGTALCWGGTVHLHAWERQPGVFVYLGVEHQDAELPVCLTAGVWRKPGSPA